MNDIADLLARLGLECHVDAFVADAVSDLGTLMLLTDGDLKELGLPLGHRRKLLAALACGGVPSSPAPASSPQPAASEKAWPAAADGYFMPERRHLTVLFCDLLGSTELTRRLDVEDMGRITRAYQDAAAGAIGRFSGFVDRLLGDGVLAFFGYPKAHEDAAELAVRAGLEIVEALKGVRTPTGERLAARVAVASGLVFIDHARVVPAPTGVASPAAAPRERVVAGEVVNLAARLQEVAPANSVVVSPTTRGLLRGAFELEDLGAHDLKGIGGPVRAWRAARERTGAGVGTRFQAARPSGTPLPPIVGREAELALLASRWEAAARGGEGQLVLVTGDAGVGKSRLCQALCERVKDEPHFVLRYQCSPFHTHSAFHPVIAQLRRAARIEPDLSAEEKLSRLEALLGLSSPAPEREVPLLAALLSIPIEPSRYEPLRLAPEEQKRRTLEALTEQVLGLARRRPVLILVEDVHWIDPTLRDLLPFVVERAQDAPVLALVTHRAEFQSSWDALPNATTLPLSSLPKRDARNLVGGVTGADTLPPEVVEQIVARTDGIPLFVEELTKTVLEQGLGRNGGGVHALRAAHAAPAIPASLQDSLLARVDHTPLAKEVAQVGSVLGREFDHEHLAALSGLPEGTLQDALDQLLRAGLIHRRGLQRTSYVFKHALVQDAAYSTLTLERRQRLHAGCAEVLLRLSPDVAEAQPELLAHHSAEGGNPVHAAEHWLKAGRLAVERSANAEAIAHLTSGLRMLDGVQNARRRAELETALQLELGAPLIATRGYGARETVQAWERAHMLAEEGGERLQLVRALYGLWTVRVSLGKVREALFLAERVLQIAAEIGDDGIAVVGRRIRGLTLFLLGEVEAARADLERALLDYDPMRHRALAYRFGQDPRVAALAALAVVSWMQGSPEQARQSAAAALDEAERLEHANTHAYALTFGACTLAWLRRDPEELDRLADRLLALSARHHLGLWQAYGMSRKGWALSQHGGGARRAGLDMLREAQERFRLAGDGFCDPMCLGMLAEALGDAELVDEAMARFDEAITEAEARGSVWCLPELLRLKSRVVLRCGRAGCEAEAERLLRAALEHARSKGLAAWERRAAADLAEIRADPGGRATDSQPIEGDRELSIGTDRAAHTHGRRDLDHMRPARAVAGWRPEPLGGEAAT